MKLEEVRSIIKKIKNPTKLQFTIGFFVVVALLWGVRYLTRSTPQDIVEEPTTLTATHHHRIRGVANYKAEFPDSQSVQIVAAERWGVRPVQNREDAEKRKKELVYVGESPYWHVDRLSSSIPYLVPRAATLLQDIGQAFYDSLYNKGIICTITSRHLKIQSRCYSLNSVRYSAPVRHNKAFKAPLISEHLIQQPVVL